MILIADCGSTKIDWCVIDKNTMSKHPALRFETPGLNAVMLSREDISARMRQELAPSVTKIADKITHVYFYGAGCVSETICQNVADGIQPSLPKAKIEIATDLLAAARALCGHEPGIACILGTGSNSCYYDGQAIALNVSPLGYILGDEGSGAVLGKILVGDVLKNQLPADLCEAFLTEYQLDRLEIINRVYRQPQPNKFLASLSPFLHKHIHRTEVRQLVGRAFQSFFQRNVASYSYTGLETVNFVGSIAYYYADVLNEAAKLCGFSLGQVLKSPMQGLIEFHLGKI